MEHQKVQSNYVREHRRCGTSLVQRVKCDREGTGFKGWAHSKSLNKMWLSVRLILRRIARCLLKCQCPVRALLMYCCSIAMQKQSSKATNAIERGLGSKDEHIARVWTICDCLCVWFCVTSLVLCSSADVRSLLMYCYSIAMLKQSCQRQQNNAM